MKYYPVFAIAILCLASSLGAQAFNPSRAGFDSLEVAGYGERLIISDRVAWATKVDSIPRIDGDPADGCWNDALPITDFTQRNPVEGAPVSEKTEVRILYNDHSIYFLFICYDNDPDRIISRVTPRDRISSSDHINIYLDSYFDRRTAFSFTVNAVNVQRDVLRTDDTRRDDSWNSVWYSSTGIYDYGWVAEVEIPFSCLRFGSKSMHNWGLQLERWIERYKEHDQWRMIGDSESGFFVSKFGLLGGIRDIKPPRRLEILPYVMGNFQDNEQLSNDLTYDYGLDVKYGLGSDITLDFTVNPEFGTVETDEEQLNLSPFPTYYPEKRPFFLEFRDVFDTSINLVHSRRIGKPLGNAINPNASIIGGARMVGKTESGLRYGFIEAYTDEEQYFFEDLDNDGEFDSDEEQAWRKRDEVPENARDSMETEFLAPASNFAVMRLSQEFGEQSNVGMLATLVSRDTDGGIYDANQSAFTGAMDWDIEFIDNWKFYGQVAGSRVKDVDSELNDGYGIRTGVSKYSGEHWRTWINYRRYSSSFNINDLGWLYGNQYGIQNFSSGARYQARPHKNGIRSWNIQVQGWRSWTDKKVDVLEGARYGNKNNINLGIYNGDAIVRGQEGSVSGYVQFMNYWSFFFGMGSDLKKASEPFRAGEDYDFIYVYPVQSYYWWGMRTDPSKVFRVSLNQNGGGYRDGTRWKGNFEFRFRPMSNLEFELEPSLDKRWGFSDFSSIEDIPDPDAPEKILTLRRTTYESLVFRTNYSINTRLDLRLFAQYTDFESKRYDRLDPLQEYDLEDPIETNSTFGIHFVTRFEYRPGSYFYLVYKENRRDDEDGRFGKPERQLIGKLTYWFNQG